LAGVEDGDDFFASKVIQATDDPLTELLRLTLPLSVDRSKSTTVKYPVVIKAGDPRGMLQAEDQQTLKRKPKY